MQLVDDEESPEAKPATKKEEVIPFNEMEPNIRDLFKDSRTDRNHEEEQTNQDDKEVLLHLLRND